MEQSSSTPTWPLPFGIRSKLLADCGSSHLFFEASQEAMSFLLDKSLFSYHYANMRTTIDLPDALMMIVAERATAEGRSLKSVMGEALSLGLHKKAGTQERWVCATHALGGQRFDYTKAWALVDGLEAEAVVEKLERLK